MKNVITLTSQFQPIQPKILHKMMYSTSRCSIFILLVFLNLQIAFAQNSFPDFYVGPFSGMLQKAKAASKPFVVYFTAEECRACEKMESSTLVDNASVAYLNEHFLIHEVDGRSLMEGGMEIAEQFGVSVFPTLMFFSSEGKPLHKIVGFIKAEHFLANLEQEYENSLRINELETRNSIFDIAQLSHFDMSKPMPAKSFKESTYASAYSKAYAEEEEELDYASLSKVYNLAAVPNASYGIQLGIFSNKKQLDEAIQSYQQRLVDVYVTVETEVNGKRCYKLLVGLYESQEMAMIKQQQLENELIASGFVLNYKDLRNTDASVDTESILLAAEPN